MPDPLSILKSARTIAVVGLSDNPDRSSFGVAQYLRAAGYRIIPVNPRITSWEGIPAVASLADVTEHVDIVDVFRRPEHVPDIVREAVAIGAGAVWAQQGIRSAEAAQIAEESGIPYFEDRCLAVEYSIHKNELRG